MTPVSDPYHPGAGVGCGWRHSADDEEQRSRRRRPHAPRRGRHGRFGQLFRQKKLQTDNKSLKNGAPLYKADILAQSTGSGAAPLISPGKAAALVQEAAVHAIGLPGRGMLEADVPTHASAPPRPAESSPTCISRYPWRSTANHALVDCDAHHRKEIEIWTRGSQPEPASDGTRRITPYGQGTGREQLVLRATKGAREPWMLLFLRVGEARPDALHGGKAFLQRGRGVRYGFRFHVVVWSFQGSSLPGEKQLIGRAEGSRLCRVRTSLAWGC